MGICECLISIKPMQNHLPRPWKFPGNGFLLIHVYFPISKISLVLLLSTCLDIDIAAPISPDSPHQAFLDLYLNSYPQGPLL